MFSNNGGVLSDREICFLSEIPRHVAEYEIKDFAKYAKFKKSLYYRNRTKEFGNGTALCLLGSDPSFHPSESTSGLKPLKFYHDYFRGSEVNEVRREWKDWQPMITPFEPSLVQDRVIRLYADDGYTKKVISYGVSSYGYDIRSSRQFKVFTNVNNSLLDPKNFDSNAFVEIEADEVIIPPHSFLLTRSEERFFIPRDIITVCLGKSSYARLGLVPGVTPFEPEWEGYATLEFSNTTSLPMKFYAGEGCAQILFLRASQTCKTSYADRGGKYNNQAPEPVVSKV